MSCYKGAVKGNDAFHTHFYTSNSRPLHIKLNHLRPPTLNPHSPCLALIMTPP